VAFALSEIVVVSFRDGDLGGEEFAFASYMDMLGRNAFGNFRTLLEDVTLHHAMGFYLDLMRSEKEDPATGRQPNENFPREVMQLFSIGLNQLNADGTVKMLNGAPIPTYDQDVVLGFAKALSGWSVGTNPKTDQGFYDIPYPRMHPFWVTPMQAFPTKHSTATKLLLNGVTLAAGQAPEKDLKDALDNIFNHPNVGPFIGKQLIQRLVSSNPSPAYVGRVAAAFANNGAGVRGDMKAVIKAILLDPEARDRNAALGSGFGKQREPIVRLANLVRAFKGTSPNGEYQFWYTQIIDYGLGQQYFMSPSVFNFFQPDYAPQGPVANAALLAPEFQISSDSQLMSAANTMYALIFWGYGFGDNNPVNLNYAEFVPVANDPALLVDRLDLLMTGGLTSTATRNAIIGAVSAEPAANAAERVKKAVYLFTISPDYAIQK
jgi:endo-chitodextinase